MSAAVGQGHRLRSRSLPLPLPTAAAAAAHCCRPLLPHLPQGLLKFDYSTRDVTLLATHVSSGSRIDPGSPITYANDLAIARDGSIYLTSCTGVTHLKSDTDSLCVCHSVVWVCGCGSVKPKQ